MGFGKGKRVKLWHAIFQRRYVGIRGELQKLVPELASSKALELIESAACFSYRRRAGAVQRLLGHPYFAALSAARPLQAEEGWKLPTPTSDIKHELLDEIKLQQVMLSGSSSGAQPRQACPGSAREFVKESVIK